MQTNSIKCVYTNNVTNWSLLQFHYKYKTHENDLKKSEMEHTCVDCSVGV